MSLGLPRVDHHGHDHLQHLEAIDLHPCLVQTDGLPFEFRRPVDRADIDANPNDRDAIRLLDQYASKFPPVQKNIIRRFDAQPTRQDIAKRYDNPRGDRARTFWLRRRRQYHTECKAGLASVYPLIALLATARRLMTCHNNAAKTHCLGRILG